MTRTFGRRGRAVLDARMKGFSELIIRPDGKYVVFGSTGDSSASGLAAARYVIPAAGPA